jgi:hypothetical protein
VRIPVWVLFLFVGKSAAGGSIAVFRVWLRFSSFGCAARIVVRIAFCVVRAKHAIHITHDAIRYEHRNRNRITQPAQNTYKLDSHPLTVQTAFPAFAIGRIGCIMCVYYQAGGASPALQKPDARCYREVEMAKLTKLEDIVSLCKRRGFIFQSSEIYGGLASCYDYGPLGVELKNNVKKAWWKNVVQMRDDVVGIDCSILMHPLVWKASGHADQFADLVAECKKCNTRTRVDHLKDRQNDSAEEHTEHIALAAAAAGQHDLSKKVCPACGAVGNFTGAMPFNLMFETKMGANVDDSMTLFLRPETAQGIFANFRNVLDTTRVKIPFGIA